MGHVIYTVFVLTMLSADTNIYNRGYVNFKIVFVGVITFYFTLLFFYIFSDFDAALSVD